MRIALQSMEKLAEAMGVSLRTVANLSKKKGCPGKGPDGYDVEAWKVWHDKTRLNNNRLPLHGTQEAAKEGPNAGGPTLLELRSKTIPQLRAEEAALKIEERRLKIAKLNGENIPREVVVMVLGKFVSEMRTRLVAIKGQAPRLAMMTDVVKIEQLLDDNITAAMDGVSRLPWKPDNN
jgi:hypothetical protein